MTKNKQKTYITKTKWPQEKIHHLHNGFGWRLCCHLFIHCSSLWVGQSMAWGVGLDWVYWFNRGMGEGFRICKSSCFFSSYQFHLPNSLFKKKKNLPDFFPIEIRGKGHIKLQKVELLLDCQDYRYKVRVIKNILVPIFSTVNITKA